MAEPYPPRVLNPSRLRVIAVGRVRRGWVSEGLELYRRRLPGLEILEVKDSTPQREAEAILALLHPGERLVALSEEGQRQDSVGLARQLADQAGERLAFAIGGADGLATGLKARASWLLSLSPLTFPHEIARLLLVEQLYRARTILEGGPYHRS
ncbi:MAG: 23S rRNA (pseudouridine(1915)-N(3))-methyltransferase RlmH [Synechococcaceae cyanobacterium]|nr:23S rRNA (pseudouridine(1915)-N(3))-methyltransferase RlmH [Synechococcaceae cyanobacterium]